MPKLHRYSWSMGMKGDTWKSLENEGASAFVPRDDIRMAFVPRGVGDFGDDGRGSAAVVEDVVEAHRVESVAQSAQMGEHADRASRPCSGSDLDFVPDGGIQGGGPGIHVIGPTEPVGRGAAGRPEPVAVEHPGQFRQVEVAHVQAITEFVSDRPVSAVQDLALVQTTLHQSAFPNRAQTWRALSTPASWNPLPQ